MLRCFVDEITIYYEAQLCTISLDCTCVPKYGTVILITANSLVVLKSTTKMGNIMNALDALLEIVTEDLVRYETEYLKYELGEDTNMSPHELRQTIESLRSELAELEQQKLS